MKARYLVGVTRIAFGLLALTAVGVQLQYGLARPPFNVGNFLSFFTIQSNILAALLLVMAGLGALLDKQDGRLAMLRGAATLYMATTGVVYVLLLSGLEESLQTPLPWVNFTLHYLMPVVVVVDWFWHLPPRRISFRQSLIWLTFPIGYVLYSLVRGQLSGWYPYPFLDPSAEGYVVVALTCAIIALATVGFAWLVAVSTHRQRS